MNSFVHRRKTEEWAREVGFPAAAAAAIGRANDEVDRLHLSRSRYHLRPALLLGPDRRGETAERHLLRAREAAHQGEGEEVWRHLGYGLHALQDREAHGPWWLLGIHWFRWLDDPARTLWGRPDRTHARLARIAQISQDYLRRAWEVARIRQCAAGAEDEN